MMSVSYHIKSGSRLLLLYRPSTQTACSKPVLIIKNISWCLVIYLELEFGSLLPSCIEWLLRTPLAYTLGNYLKTHPSNLGW